MDGLVIRRGRVSDAPALAVFAERAFRDAFAADNHPDDMAAYCATAFAPAIQQAQLMDEAIDTLVVEDAQGQLAGYAQLRPGAPPVAAVTEPLELWRFYVDRSHHGRGIARRLMEAVCDAARARGVRTLWLGVWEHNHRARAFYRKVGFADIGSQTFTLGTDVQTDRVMARSIQ